MVTEKTNESPLLLFVRLCLYAVVASLLGLAFSACAGAQIATAKGIDGAAQIGVLLGKDVIPTIDREKRDAIIAKAKAAGTQEGVAQARVEEAAWNESLAKIKQGARVYEASITRASAQFILVVAGTNKTLTFAAILSELGQSTLTLYNLLKEFGIDLDKYIGGGKS